MVYYTGSISPTGTGYAPPSWDRAKGVEPYKGRAGGRPESDYDSRSVSGGWGRRSRSAASPKDSATVTAASAYGADTPWNQYDKAEPYLGGFPENFGYRIPTSLDEWEASIRTAPVSWRPGMGYDKPAPTVARHMAPLYRDGMQYLYAQVNKLTPGEIGDWQKFFRLNGWKTNPLGAGIWGAEEQVAMSEFMARANATGGITVDELRTLVLDGLKSGSIAPGTLAGSKGGALGTAGGAGVSMADTAPQTTVSTTSNTQISLTGKKDAMKLLRGSLADQIGRAPTDAEVKRFLRELNAAERADPTVSTTKQTSTYYPETGKTVSKSSTKTKQSSVNPQAEAEDAARADTPERRAYQSMNYVRSIFEELGI